jgi:hypothetical protein
MSRRETIRNTVKAQRAGRCSTTGPKSGTSLIYQSRSWSSGELAKTAKGENYDGAFPSRPLSARHCTSHQEATTALSQLSQSRPQLGMAAWGQTCAFHDGRGKDG